MAYTMPAAAAGGNSLSSVEYNRMRALVLDPPRCKTYQSGGGQAITTATDTAVILNAESWDNDAAHDTVTNNTRITPQTAGTHLFIGQVVFPANATGIRRVWIRLNGTTTYGSVLVQAASTGTPQTHIQVAAEIVMNGSSDYVELMCHQSSGGGLTLGTGAGSTWLLSRWVAA